ncbi:MAG: nitrilase-related carbon-nitrogen hydrolase [Amaricoccus sp.]|uniref:nitrilase-related carbon-nitrogen hydrolase n=1 Tax=Amaricoccus sp. TaxID=1872485 RepID=UPI0039E6C0B7
MKLAAAAFPIEWHSRWNDYVGKLRVWVRTAAGQGAEVLVFPQLAALELASLAGPDNAKDPDRAIEAVTARLKDVDDLHASLAREFRVMICAATGPVRLRSGGTVDRARLFGPDGSVGHQDRLTVDPDEPLRLDAGDTARVFETGLGGIGVLVGADLTRPEIARAMVEAGAGLLLAPGAADIPRGVARLRIAARARAAETGVPVAAAMTIGTVDWLPAARAGYGAAGIYVPPAPGLPDDGVFAMGKVDTPGWTFAELDLALSGLGTALRPAWPAEVERVPLGQSVRPKKNLS